jgi:hypothetical protein
MQKMVRVELACQTFIGGQGDKSAKNRSCWVDMLVEIN